MAKTFTDLLDAVENEINDLDDLPDHITADVAERLDRHGYTILPTALTKLRLSANHIAESFTWLHENSRNGRHVCLTTIGAEPTQVAVIMAASTTPTNALRCTMWDASGSSSHEETLRIQEVLARGFTEVIEQQSAIAICPQIRFEERPKPAAPAL